MSQGSYWQQRIGLCIFVLGVGLGTSTAQQVGKLPDAPTQQSSMVAEVSQPSSGVSSSADWIGQQQVSPEPTGQQQTGPQPATLQPDPQAPAAQTPAQAQAPETEQERRERAKKELEGEEKQRMLGIIPNFNSVMSGHAAPLTKGEKFHLFFKASVDPFQFFAAGVDAGIEQAEDSYPGYGQGAEGFAKRYGASFADGFDGNFWGNALLPAVLHQDPRYFRLGVGTFKHRLWYSVLSTVRTKGDNGNWQPNYSNVAGNLIGGAISNLYYPASDRGVGLTIQRGLTVSAEGAIGSLAVEFYPDVIEHYRNRHKARAKP